MKVAIIQSGNSGFFPRFYNNLYDSLQSANHKAILFSPRTGRNLKNKLRGQVNWGSRINWHVHNMLYKLTGIKDVYSTIDTLDLIRKLNNSRPDIIHFHVIGEGILNLPLLMHYISRKEIPLVWTMHDCRAFTGGCPYFDEIGCDKWKTGCGNCPDIQYRSAWRDGTGQQWKLMKSALSGIKDFTIVTPSKWLQEFVAQSFLNKYDCKVIYNGINQLPFRNADGSTIRNSMKLENKKVVLGIAASWTARKGLDSFKYLATSLPDEYQVVLVGEIHEDIPGIIKVPPTSDINLIASYYKMADVFCNPTFADNFPTTNIEALSAGIPVVTYRTGGSPEALDTGSGIVVEKGNKQKLTEAIMKICSSIGKYTEESCVKRSESFGLSQYNEYINLYERLLNR